MAQARAQTTVVREVSVLALAGLAALALGGWAVTQRRLAACRHALVDERADQITGVPTRRAWYELAGSRVGAPREQLSLLLADVDDLKPINDSLGHDAGHAVLAATAERMRTALDGRLVPGRLGGDEFGLLLRRPQRSDLARLDLALRAPRSGAHQRGHRYGRPGQRLPRRRVGPLGRGPSWSPAHAGRPPHVPGESCPPHNGQPNTRLSRSSAPPDRGS